MIELSIIIPVYNSARYLNQCLNSVLAEAPENSEIILVDDGSTDGSADILDGYKEKDGRVVVIHKPNGGVSAARNDGIVVARGEKIFFIDSDDYIPKGYFPKMLAENADAVISNYTAIYDGGKSIEGREKDANYNSLHDFLLDFNEYFVLLFNCVWGKIYKTSIIKDNSIRFTDKCTMVEDVLFNLEYYKRCETFAYLSMPKLIYRQTGESLSHTFKADLFYIYKDSFGKIYGFLNDNGAFTDKNRDSFYSNYFGSVTESLRGAAKSSDKYRIIKDICEDDFTQTSIKYNRSFWLKGVCRAIEKKRVKAVANKFRNYLFLLKVKRFLRALRVVR